MPTTVDSSTPSAKPRVSRATVLRNANKPHPPTQGPVSGQIDRLFLQEALDLVKELGKDTERTDPRVVMLRLVQDSFLMVQALQALVRGLEVKHLEALGKYQQITLPSGETISVPHQDAQVAKERMSLLGEWVDRSTRVASLAVRAGLEERLVDLAEAQAKHMALLLQRFVRSLSQKLDLSPAQQDIAVNLIVEEVRLLGTAEPSPASAG